MELAGVLYTRTREVLGSYLAQDTGCLNLSKTEFIYNLI
jgi:hypothetical protein